jgi:hypothetical protein
MRSVQEEILNKLEDVSKGKIVFPSDFMALGSDDAIRQALSRLTKEGKIIRLAQGIYLYPEKDDVLGVLYPPIEEIAAAIARRDKARIIPTGVQALNRLGLSTQVPLKAVYLTDGAPRTIKVGKRTIAFRKTAPKMLAVKNETAGLVIAALQEIGLNNVTKETIDKLKVILKNQPKKNILEDIHLAPVWIQKLIKSILEKKLYE